MTQSIAVSHSIQDCRRISNNLAKNGFAYMPASVTRGFFAESCENTWGEFAASWDSLELDTFMNDGGRYRLRRHAVFRADKTSIVRFPHRPHFQTKDYNALNGGMLRLFAPISDSVARNLITLAAIRTFLKLIEAVFPSGASSGWDIEMHQFRIEARPGYTGLPTPEGMHRDGVDYVAMMLIGRADVIGAETILEADNKQPLMRVTLTETFDAILLDDGRIWHGTTPLLAARRDSVGFRDVLVLTYRRMHAA